MINIFMDMNKTTFEAICESITECDPLASRISPDAILWRSVNDGKAIQAKAIRTGGNK